MRQKTIAKGTAGVFCKFAVDSKIFLLLVEIFSITGFHMQTN
jgi:hypothetical protein